MIKATKEEYTRFINRLYSELPLNSIYERFGHLTSKVWIKRAYNDKRLGNLLRKKDPKYFNYLYNLWRLGRGKYAE